MPSVHTISDIQTVVRLKDEWDHLQQKAHAVAREAEDARLAYGKVIKEMIDLCKVQTDTVYFVLGRAVIFRKTRRDDDRCRDEDVYDYTFEIVEVAK